MMQLQTSFRCRRRAVYGVLAAAVVACGTVEPEPAPAPPIATPPPVERDAGAELDRGSWASRYYHGFLAERLAGDRGDARSAYEEVLAPSSGAEPEVQARAALRLADLELSSGNRRRAQELVARASVLGRGSLEILERTDRAQTRLASLRSRGSEVRGPPAGTALSAVRSPTQQQFAAAEALLEDYHRRKLQPRLEGVRTGIRAKERAGDVAERAYRHLLDDEREAQVAAQFRIGSLHHDLALALLFDVPPELEKEAAAKLRRSLRMRALSHLRRARTAYESSLEVAQDRTEASTERWRLAADVGLRGVKDLLAGQQ